MCSIVEPVVYASLGAHVGASSFNGSTPPSGLVSGRGFFVIGLFESAASTAVAESGGGQTNL